MTVTPATYNELVIYKGANFDFSFILKDGETPIDLTGYSVRMQVRYLCSDNLFLEFTPQNNRIEITELEGKVVFTLSFSTTESLEAGVYKYDIEVFNANRVDRYLQGKIKVVEEVTK